MQNIRLLIEYDGTGYHGWQTQSPAASRESKNQKRKKVITIQEILQEGIRSITGEEVKVIAASRTDAGVHALGQAACFKTGSRLEPQVMKRALNAVLPEDIRILSAEGAAEGFHPRYDATSKSYFYIIDNSGVSSAFLHKYAWKVPYRLDIRTMKKVNKMLTGKHDFSAFRGAGCGAKSTVREVISLDIRTMKGIDFMTARLEGAFIVIRIEADAFLRHMVRNIVGTLVEVGRGRMNEDSVSMALSHKDRKRTGPTAPANGLFLEVVRY